MNLDQYIPIQKNRKHIYELFYTLLTKNKSSDLEINNDELKKMALNIERGIFNNAINDYGIVTKNDVWNDHFKSIYTNRAAIIFTNLDPTNKLQNSNLIKRFFKKEFNEFQLAKMDGKMMFPERWDKLYGEFIKEEVIPEQIEIQDGLFKCGRCKTYKTTYYQLQTRSADEPLTTFVTCINCDNRWKF